MSVPLLAASKVLLESADHPLAKMALNVRNLPLPSALPRINLVAPCTQMIRESTAIDDGVEAQRGRKERSHRKKLRKGPRWKRRLHEELEVVEAFKNPLETPASPSTDGGDMSPTDSDEATGE